MQLGLTLVGFEDEAPGGSNVAAIAASETSDPEELVEAVYDAIDL